METEHPLVFGEQNEQLGTLNGPLPASPRPKLEAVARKVLAILEPLEPAARSRVLRAAAILLEVDDAAPWIR